jgi:hypothetical protein
MRQRRARQAFGTRYRRVKFAYQPMPGHIFIFPGSRLARGLSNGGKSDPGHPQCAAYGHLRPSGYSVPHLRLLPQHGSHGRDHQRGWIRRLRRHAGHAGRHLGAPCGDPFQGGRSAFRGRSPAAAGHGGQERLGGRGSHDPRSPQGLREAPQGEVQGAGSHREVLLLLGGTLE